MPAAAKRAQQAAAVLLKHAAREPAVVLRHAVPGPAVVLVLSHAARAPEVSEPEAPHSKVPGRAARRRATVSAGARV